MTTLTLPKEDFRSYIKEMTKKFLSEGNLIEKVPRSKTQESYVYNTHGCISGRLGWFEVG